MPGLFGILAKVERLSKERLERLGTRMARSMQVAPWLQTEIWSDETFCGGRVYLGASNPSQPAVSADRVSSVWFDGEMLQAGEEMRAPLCADEIVKLVADPGALANADGSFATACFSSKSKILSLANDRLGFRPLYFTETEDLFAFASEVKALLAILPKLPPLDEISLKQFLSFDYILGERTWWKGIELLPPASLWTIEATGKKRLATYWTFANIKRDPQSEQDVARKFRILWSRAIQRRYRPGVMPLLLSGGLDSRLLLAELRAQGVNLVTITFGESTCLDMKIAQRCARRADVSHRAIMLRSDNWWVGREAAIWQTDGLINSIHCHGASAVEAMHTGNNYTMMNSTGDTLFGGSKLVDTSVDNWRDSSRLLHEMYLANPFVLRDDAVEISVGDCQRYLCGPGPDCFTISQRQRRFILSGTMYFWPYCEVSNPGVDIDLLTLFLGHLTESGRAASRFYNRCLVEWYPELFSTMPWQKTGRGLCEPAVLKSARDLMSWGIQHGRSVAARHSASVPGLWRVAAKLATIKEFANYDKYVRVSGFREALARENLVLDEYLGGNVAVLLKSQIPLDARTLIAISTIETYLGQVQGLCPLTQ
jgi:hypothetical protein